MRALVTGSSGFLGSHIVDHLKLAGFEVVAFDLKEPHREDLEFVIGDVRDKEAVMKAVKGCDYIFHNAAIANIDDSYKAPFETIGVNVIGTLTLLEAARIEGLKRFVLASSVYVSSDMGSLYRVSKITSELLCETYEKDFGVPYTLIRYGSLYGRRSNTWNMVFDICTKLLEKGEYTYNGTGEEIREFINVEDAARETIRVATDEQFRNKVVLIAGHQRMKMRDFFSMVAEMFPQEVKIHYAGSLSKLHYNVTPYRFKRDLPIRINMSTFVDIGEGITACIEEAEKELRKLNEADIEFF